MDRQKIFNKVAKHLLKQKGVSLGKSGNIQSDIYFLQDLQDIHDNFSPRSWRKRLKEFAEKNCLKANVLK